MYDRNERRNSTNYTFNATIAQKFGVHEALFIHNLHWWIRKNEQEGTHFHDGKTWTYNSTAAFAEIFPFFTHGQLRRIIENLAKMGAISIGNYNKTKVDRTRWYALSDKILEIYRTAEQMKTAKSTDADGTNATAQNDQCNGQQEATQTAKVTNTSDQNAQTQLAKPTNAKGETAPPIPYINTNINTNINSERERRAQAHEAGAIPPTRNHTPKNPARKTQKTKNTMPPM